MNIETFTLPNGLRVALNEDRSAPLVAVNLWYHVGSKNERPGRTGFAHLFEHMLFAGSEHVGNNEHFRYVQSVGGNLNASTTFDRTNYFETLPSNYLALALWLESDRMGFYLPAISEEKFAIQKSVVKEERRLRFDNAPYGIALEELLKLGFEEGHPYHSFVIGSMADLDASSIDDVRDFFSRFYGPNNAVLTLVGDFDGSEARELVEQYFGDISPAAEIPPVVTQKRPLAGDRRQTIASAVQLPRFYRLYHVPRFGDREWIACDVLAGALGMGKASRLERALVYEQQIAQDVAAFAWDTELTGMLLFWATAREDASLDDVEKAFDAEIARIARDGLEEIEITRVRNQTETDYAHQIEDFDSRADLISRMYTFFDDPHVVDSWFERYQDVTLADVNAAARRYLTPENRVTLRMVPASDGEES
ncbi:MAG: M16 family metallopeptidase [Thermoanaerobaculia bacterium]